MVVSTRLQRLALITRRASLCGAALSLVLLSGCGDDMYKGIDKKDKDYTSYIDTLEPVNTTPAPQEPVVSPLPSGDLRSDLGVDSPRLGEYSGRDLTEKADAFWKYHAICKALTEGRVEPTLPAELSKLELSISKMDSDKNVVALREILAQIRTGLEARSLNEQLAARGVPSASIPWSSGAFTVKKALAESKRGASSTSSSPSKAAAGVAQEVADWATRHHKAPAVVQDACFRKAAELTRDLGDTLDEERRGAGNHSLGRENQAPEAGLGNPFDSTLAPPPLPNR